MGTFIDRHHVEAIDPAVRRQLQFEALHGIREASGTLPLGHWVEDGIIYCLIEAADEDAVRRHHRARGVSCDDLQPVPGLTGERPLSGDDRLLVVGEIRRSWPADQVAQLSS